ncbi:MAG: hypothetical protein D3926_05070, partial [Desulfobacteraceae bacterium]
KLRIAWEKSVSPSDQVKLLLTWQGGSKQQHLATVQNNGQYYWQVSVPFREQRNDCRIVVRHPTLQYIAKSSYFTIKPRK